MSSINLKLDVLLSLCFTLVRCLESTALLIPNYTLHIGSFLPDTQVSMYWTFKWQQFTDRYKCTCYVDILVVLLQYRKQSFLSIIRWKGWVFERRLYDNACVIMISAIAYCFDISYLPLFYTSHIGFTNWMQYTNS